MGILNTTPDSFSDGGLFIDPGKAVDHALDMIAQGADIIDIGGESSRPGAEPVSAATEMKRVLPVIEALRAQSDICISIDTVKPNVARQAIAAGANIVNDITSCGNPAMVQVVREEQVPVILMHMKGTPQTMQIKPEYDNVIETIKHYLSERITELETQGVPRDHIIIDPGLGFGKTVNDNFIILKQLAEFQSLNKPILIGPSRKSFIGLTLDLPPEERLEGTIAAAVVGVLNGARIVRAHDVKALKRAMRITEKLLPEA